MFLINIFKSTATSIINLSSKVEFWNNYNDNFELAKNIKTKFATEIEIAQKRIK